MCFIKIARKECKTKAARERRRLYGKDMRQTMKEKTKTKMMMWDY